MLHRTLQGIFSRSDRNFALREFTVYKRKGVYIINCKTGYKVTRNKVLLGFPGETWCSKGWGSECIMDKDGVCLYSFYIYLLIMHGVDNTYIIDW